MLLGCLYRPPSATVKFFEDYQSVLENILAFFQQYVAIVLHVLGDFNIDFKVSTNKSHIQSSSVQRLHNISDILNLQQLVTFTTRDGNSPTNSGSVIDLLFTNRPDLFSIVTQHSGLGNSDHYGVYFNLLTFHDKKNYE